MTAAKVPTLAVPLTADALGAIAVIRVSGPHALEIADQTFRPVRGPSLSRTPVGAIRFGRAGAAMGDEVVAVVVSSEEVEIHAHGGKLARILVLEALEAHGARIASPSRFATLAELALAAAPTRRVADILNNQVGGASTKALAEIRRAIVSNDGRGASLLLGDLIANGEVGLRLIAGWRVVLTGRPNVGKSRLLNALSGFDRAIVAAEAGTTRDVVTFRTALDGWPVEIADTAGIRLPETALEADGIDRANDQLARADLVLRVLDRSEPLRPEDRDAIGSFASRLLVANKADLPAEWAEASIGALAVSAQTGDGLDRLLREIAHRLVPNPPGPGAGVPLDQETIRRLIESRAKLESGRNEGALASLDALLV